MNQKIENLHRLENAALNRLLRRALARAAPAIHSLTPAPPATSGPLQILDLACGTCRESGTLAQVFREFDGNGREVRLVGTDIRDRELEEADARSKLVRQPGDQFEFFRENGTKMHRHQLLGSDFDVTFLRHQNYWNDQAVWERIFGQGLERLKENGLLVITSYFDREHALALEALQRSGAELLVSERNEASRVLDTPGKSVDRHLAIFRRKE